MKIFFSILFLVFSISLMAQDRVKINGKITPPVRESAEGISVVNRTAKTATISNESGTFTIRVAAGDTLTFNALQYEDFSVIVDKGVVESRQLNVFIRESVTELPEVVVTPYDLTGNVEVDVRRIPTVEIDLPTQTAAEINDYEYTFRPDSLVSPQNAAMRTAMIESGANFANIFRNIFTSRRITTNVGGSKAIDDQIKQLYDDEFFVDQLNIRRENINEFILFAEDNGLNPSMLEPKNEMVLIDFLVAQSQKYKQRKLSDQ